jgi:Sulfotransferase domain
MTGVANTGGSDPTTVFHVTHAKAGSQWIYTILAACVPDRIVTPEIDSVQVLTRPIRPGAVYPVLFLTREEFELITLPPSSRWFVIIRDLRDTLVSLYYSVKFSHPVLAAWIGEGRQLLRSMPLEDGLLYALEEWLPRCGEIQESWLIPDQPLIRYEQLLTNDLPILERVLLDQCGLQVFREQFREVVLACRFERLTGGRPRGQEDPTSHNRKGVAGDWRGQFTDRVKTAFKARFGELLIATGYERDLRW